MDWHLTFILAIASYGCCMRGGDSKCSEVLQILDSRLISSVFAMLAKVCFTAKASNKHLELLKSCINRAHMSTHCPVGVILLPFISMQLERMRLCQQLCYAVTKTWQIVQTDHEVHHGPWSQRSHIHFRQQLPTRVPADCKPWVVDRLWVRKLHPQVWIKLDWCPFWHSSGTDFGQCSAVSEQWEV